jgi:superfamily I DNA and/or RNA helicase
VDALKAHAAEAPAYEKIFDLFGTLFTGQEKRGRLDEPLGRLDTQHRMRVDIANLVGRSFYRIEVIPRQLRTDAMQRALDRDPDATWLKSGRNVERPHLIRSIPFFMDEGGKRERSVAWLATDGMKDAEDHPYWSNKGEARLIEKVVQRLQPMPHAGRDGFLAEPVVILTPYRAQVNELKQAVPSLSNQVYTVDGFQGRQADIVIVSLVRSVMRGSTPESSIGYLVEPSRVNVMFSRARRLLVIVGNYGHFQGIVGRFGGTRKDLLGWKCLLRDVEKLGHLVDGEQVAAWVGDR